MRKSSQAVLLFDSLKIGYKKGKEKKILLPPLNACAKKGELIAVIGRNGIGKSTLLRTLAGLQLSLGGDIFYNEKNISDYSRIDLAQKVGYISTEIVRVSNMTVYDLVAIGRFPYTNWFGRVDSENHNMIMDSLERTSMLSYSKRFVSELSDGERQRAMIARLLAQDTGIMVMDEPTAFLDIGSKYEILHLMHQLTRERGKTIIFSTHDLHMAISQSDKIWLVLNNILEEGAPEDLLIRGSFDHLFDSSPVQFNTENGTFSFRGEERGRIFIDGEGLYRHWTEKAINRIGFNVSLKKTYPHIMVPSKNTGLWHLFLNADISLQFNSIYDLVKWLGDNDIRAI